MRVIVQLVKEASVTIDDQEISSIKKGFLLLVAFTHEEKQEIIEKMARKCAKLRIFPDKNGKINLSLNDVGGDILSVSQFTLYGDVKEGYRPSFILSERPEVAIKEYEFFNSCLEKELGKPIKTGVFGADMKVSLINDGPTTIILDSERLFQ